MQWFSWHNHIGWCTGVVSRDYSVLWLRYAGYYRNNGSIVGNFHQQPNATANSFLTLIHYWLTPPGHHYRHQCDLYVLHMQKSSIHCVPRNVTTLSQCNTVKVTSYFYEELQTLGIRNSKTTEPTDTKFNTGNYIALSLHMPNFNAITWWGHPCSSVKQ